MMYIIQRNMMYIVPYDSMVYSISCHISYLMSYIVSYVIYRIVCHISYLMSYIVSYVIYDSMVYHISYVIYIVLYIMFSKHSDSCDIAILCSAKIHMIQPYHIVKTFTQYSYIILCKHSYYVNITHFYLLF